MLKLCRLGGANAHFAPPGSATDIALSNQVPPKNFRHDFINYEARNDAGRGPLIAGLFP